MALKEMLAEIGMPPEDISEFFRLGEAGLYDAQVKLLRKYREELLEGIHRDEKIISNLDYMIYEIRNQKSSE